MKIYIPVWLDQKVYKAINDLIYSSIYIPVWLDQKEYNSDKNE